jgi:hypothetical protein
LKLKIQTTTAKSILDDLDDVAALPRATETQKKNSPANETNPRESLEGDAPSAPNPQAQPHR